MSGNTLTEFWRWKPRGDAVTRLGAEIFAPVTSLILIKLQKIPWLPCLCAVHLNLEVTCCASVGTMILAQAYWLLGRSLSQYRAILQLARNFYPPWQHFRASSSDELIPKKEHPQSLRHLWVHRTKSWNLQAFEFTGRWTVTISESLFSSLTLSSL